MPGGTAWIDAATGSLHAGGQELPAPAPPVPNPRLRAPHSGAGPVSHRQRCSVSRPGR
ncbi:hypothetical protein [Streptomyces sp. NBC_01077]|uniref:hypothetical protein n=1 Tax=Streptomyces sp. NBC_01077 TaxID=2903746 RepID=UPI00386B4580